MLAIQNAIIAKFLTNGYLAATFSKGLELCLGADTENSPSAILVPVSGVPQYNNHGNWIEETVMQFTIRSSSGTTVATAMDAIKATFDHKPITLANNETLIDARIRGLNRIFKEDERMFRGDVEYLFRVCGSLF